MIVLMKLRVAHRLVRVFEVLHAAAENWEGTTTYHEAIRLLRQAECDCEQCKKRRTESGVKAE